MNRGQFSNDTEVQAFLKWAGKLECRPDGSLVPSGPPPSGGGAVGVAVPPGPVPVDVTCITVEPAPPGSQPDGVLVGPAPRDVGLAGVLPWLLVRLKIGKSGNVPNRIDEVVPFYTLTQHYRWLARGMSFGDMMTGDLAETSRVLALLEANLKAATNTSSALAACHDIIIWGGGSRHALRPSPVGATRFLTGLGGGLVQYLADAKRQLDLAGAVVPRAGTFPGILEMGAMLTKIHSLYSSDGLPIYDSRVGGAIATIIETWRQSTGRAHTPLPEELCFPSTEAAPRRRVTARYPGCIAPPSITRNSQHAAARACAWSSAKVRLGWLLSDLLTQPNPKAIRSLEACLFMAGYNCEGINPRALAVHGGVNPGGALPLAA